jgi:TonB family protein
LLVEIQEEQRAVPQRSEIEKSQLRLKAAQVPLWSVAILACCLCATGQRTASDYQVEAAYLYNFVKLAEWPKPVLPDGAPLVIGVVGGDDNFVEVLTKAVSGKTIGTHSAMVRHLSATGDLKSCQLLFFRFSERKRTQEAIASLGTSSILLVGEDKAFLQQGGSINLLLERGGIRFEVSPDALERANIHLSPQVLALGQIERSSDTFPAGGSRKIELRVPPEYPALAERMNIKGTVQVRVIVGRDGSVKKAKLIGGHPLLADAALQAVMKWKYEPGPEETTEVAKVSFGDTTTN